MTLRLVGMVARAAAGWMPRRLRGVEHILCSGVVKNERSAAGNLIYKAFEEFAVNAVPI